MNGSVVIQLSTYQTLAGTGDLHVASAALEEM